MSRSSGCDEIGWKTLWHRRPRRDRRRVDVAIEEARERYDSLSDDLAKRRDDLLGLARDHRKRGDLDGAWSFLQELEREMVPALSPEELEARIVSATCEGKEKLGSWRGDTVEVLSRRCEALPPRAGDTLEKKRRMFQEMLRQLHTRHQNVYHKLDQLRAQVYRAGALVALTLVGVVVVNARDGFAILDEPSALAFTQLLWLALLSGWLGGVLSVAYSAIRLDLSARIPEVSASFVVTVVRPLLGAVIALPVLLLVESGLIDTGSFPKPWLLLGSCFLAGFSERWFLGLVGDAGARVRGSGKG